MLNVKMPTIVGILKFMSMIIIVGILTCTSMINFMLSSVEQVEKFYKLGTRSASGKHVIMMLLMNTHEKYFVDR